MFPAQIISHLGLEKHPEGGWYRQTWLHEPETGQPAGSSIYFLLERNERSHWHQLDATEIWHFYAGEPLILSVSETDKGPASERWLGPNLAANQYPQIVVPKGHWQSARPSGAWALVGCTVTPGFSFDMFTLAPSDFDIPKT